MMLRVFLFSALLALSSAATFQNSVVITSADVPLDQPMALSTLQSKNAYRVYATYSSSGSDDYAKNVLIYDATGITYTVYSLSQAKPDSGYILDTIHMLRAPITIRDTNKGAVSRTPFTVYIVDSTYATFPVVNARLAPTGEVDSSNGFLGAGVTVLSAEPYFTMFNFDIGSISSMFISSVGYDESSSDYNLISFYSANEARISFLTLYGPIATLFNANWFDARFKFQFTKNTKYDYSLSPGSTFAIASPGYLSKTASYNIPYTVTDVSDALARSYQFSDFCWVQTWYNAGDYQNSESVQLQFANQDNDHNTINVKNGDNGWQGQWSNGISVKVLNPSANHAPRFLFQITSGASLSFSLLGLLLVSLFAKF